MPEGVMANAVGLDECEQRVLLLPPTARDGEAIGVLLSDAGISYVPCETMTQACGQIARGAAVLMCSEESLAIGAEHLAACLQSQPFWSDLPIIVLARTGVESPTLAAAVARAGNVTVVERPVRIGTLLSVVRAALRARGRQYEVRAHMAERAAAEAALQRSEARYRALATASSEVAYSLSPDWAVLQPLDGRGLVASNTEPISDWLTKNIYPADIPVVMAAIAKVIAEKSLFQLEHRVNRPDGSVGWTFSRAVPILDEHGEIAEWFGSAADITDRKRAEVALAVSEQRLRQAKEASGLGIHEYDVANGTIHWDERVRSLWGVGPDEVITFELFMSGLHPDDRAPTQAAVERAFDPSGEGAYAAEYRVTSRVDGRTRWVAASGQVTFIAGKAVRLIGTTQDITARKRAEEDLRASEERFRRLVEGAPFGMYIVDSDFRIAHMNTRSQEGAFVNVRPLIGRSFEEAVRILWPEPVAQSLIREFRHTLTTGEPYYSSNFVNTRADKDQVEGYEWELQQIDMPDGRKGVICYYYDSSDLRRVEAALRASEEQFRTFTDTAPAMLWVTDTEGMCTFLSRGWYEFTGQTEAEALGTGWTTATHPEDRERSGREFLAANKSRASHFAIEYRLRRADGQYRWAMDIGRARFASDGRFLGYVGNVIDIDEQKRAADELARHRENLQALVHERTLQLEQSHRQLRLSERMAALGTLSAGLGHDMGNLLVPIRVRLDSLARAELPETLKQDVAAIQTSAEYLRKLSGGLRQLALDPSRSAANDVTELRAWWDEAEAILRTTLPRGVTLCSRVAREECWIRLARPALTQAVFNLVQNAGDAMRESGGVVSVWSECSKEAVRLGVTDNGPGMTPDVKARCIEPFFTTKTRGISTGMGLTLVYGIVAEAGGNVEIDTEPGNGTTFILTFRRGAPPSKAGAMGHNGKTAAIEVRDARLRALVTAELRSLAFDVIPRHGQALPDLLVVDDAARLNGDIGQTGVVLLGTSAGGRSGVVAIGARPSPKVIRDAITKLAGRGEEVR
ncbi:MAG TPA: PAS domain S-box protein [Phycisphaerales bacterium]